ncbi:hypothetical protein [Bryocella elongata]|nr:hypothetical protein [Bryocella elongata]
MTSDVQTGLATTINAVQAPDQQLQILRIYNRLIQLREDWAGALVFSCGAEAPRSGLAPAASIAGATSLLVAEDGHEIKKTLRRGEIDFVVNTLDEAIRTLKNEVRKKRPLSVALIGDVDATLAEMIERGIKPDVFLAGDAYPAAAQALIDSGVPRLNVVQSSAEPSAPAETAHGEQLHELFIATKTPTKLREADERILRMLPKDETARRRWIERASHYLRSASEGRWVNLTGGEAFLLESEGLKLHDVGPVAVEPEATPSSPKDATPASPAESQPTEL